MKQIVGIRFRNAGPIRFADVGDLSIKLKNYVVVRTDKGQEMGWVVWEPSEVIHMQPDDEPMIKLVRKATTSDYGRWQQSKELEEQAFKLARSHVRELQLPMKIVDAHYNFDRSRLTITFGAEGRVDFRPLLHELGATLRCRVELHQVGDRDVAKLAGGVGRCGRLLCCSSWMTKFSSISIRMAKEQELPISADGLAGACGCCAAVCATSTSSTGR